MLSGVLIYVTVHIISSEMSSYFIRPSTILLLGIFILWLFIIIIIINLGPLGSAPVGI